jgi:hypothetical protein
MTRVGDLRDLDKIFIKVAGVVSRVYRHNPLQATSPSLVGRDLNPDT